MEIIIILALINNFYCWINRSANIYIIINIAGLVVKGKSAHWLIVLN